MSSLAAIGEQQQAALNALDQCRDATRAWRDEQREQFDRSVLAPLHAEGATLRRAISRADDEVARVAQTLEL